MDILYVNPGRIAAGLDAIIKGPPLALTSIAATCRDHGARVFDFKVDKYRGDDWFRRELNRYDVVAITSLTPQVYGALEVAAMAKEQGCTTILGGYHPTLVPAEVASHPGVDYVIRGEGEHTFRELVEFIDHGGDPRQGRDQLREITGVSYVDPATGEVHHNAPRLLEPDLDNFPIPWRELLRGKKYHYFGASVEPVESARGCPHSCNYCCIHRMWKDPRGKEANARAGYRAKSLKRVMRELYSLDWSKFFTFFCEDNFTINLRRTHALLDVIIKSGLPSKLHFSCQSRVDTIANNPGLADKMVEAGFRQVFLGIESKHQKTLDWMGKRTTTEQTRKAVQMLHDRGIAIFGSIIIGSPGETREMVHENIVFARELDVDQIQFTPITAFPGTEFFDEMVGKGQVTSRNYRRYNLMQTMMRTDELTDWEIYGLVAEAYAAFFLNASWPLKKLYNYSKPWGKMRWFLPMLAPFVKQYVMSGRDMFRTQGIHLGIVSDEYRALLKERKRERKAELRRRYKEYKRLEKRLRNLRRGKVAGVRAGDQPSASRPMTPMDGNHDARATGQAAPATPATPRANSGD
ncbi:MAG: radical SAM protein [Promethearchaeota archaeon]